MNTQTQTNLIWLCVVVVSSVVMGVLGKPEWITAICAFAIAVTVLGTAVRNTKDQ